MTSKGSAEGRAAPSYGACARAPGLRAGCRCSRSRKPRWLRSTRARVCTLPRRCVFSHAARLGIRQLTPAGVSHPQRNVHASSRLGRTPSKSAASNLGRRPFLVSRFSSRGRCRAGRGAVRRRACKQLRPRRPAFDAMARTTQHGGDKGWPRRASDGAARPPSHRAQACVTLAGGPMLFLLCSTCCRTRLHSSPPIAQGRRRVSGRGRDEDEGTRRVPAVDPLSPSRSIMRTRPRGCTQEAQTPTSGA